MHGAGKIDRKKQITITPIIGSFIIKILSRRKPEIRNTDRNMLRKLRLTSEIIKELMNAIESIVSNTIGNMYNFIQKRAHSTSITAALVYNKRVEHSPQGSGRSYVNNTIIPAFAVGNANQKSNSQLITLSHCQKEVQTLLITYNRFVLAVTQANIDELLTIVSIGNKRLHTRA